jgi:hypothetical protein
MPRLIKILISFFLFILAIGLIVKWNSLQDSFILSKRFEKPESRVKSWHQDLNYLRDDYLKIDRSFNDNKEKNFKSEIDSLINNIDSLTDNQILVRIIHAVALANNAHSQVNYKFLPKAGIRVSWFKEGLFITKTSYPKRHHLGKRISKVNNLPIDQIITKFSDYIPGNIHNKRNTIPNLIIRPDFWNGINNQYSSNELIIEMIDSLGQLETDIFCIEPINSTLINLYWVDKPDSIFIKYEKTFNSLPLYLSSPNKSAIYKKLNDELIYIQLNSSTNRGISLCDFSVDLQNYFDSNSFVNIILDIRLNNGGNYNLTKNIEKGIIQELSESNGQLFLITGNQTASAAINLAASLKSHLENRITIVGEPIGDDLLFWAEPKIFKLPNSALEISASTYHHDLRNGKFKPFITNWGNLFCNFESNGLNVDIPKEISINDYISYKDPVMKTIKELIKK